MNNIIDKPLPQGPIGNNCWYQLSAGIIRFLRNNVYVSISKKDSDSGMDANSIEFLARTIDTILMQSNTVKYPSLIPAPKIHSINITSTLPENFDKTIEVKVNASDDKNQKLLYRKFATGFGVVSETGELKITFNKSTDATEDSTKARVKIWVWNKTILLHPQNWLSLFRNLRSMALRGCGGKYRSEYYKPKFPKPF
jgi:hypothetical protein